MKFTIQTGKKNEILRTKSESLLPHEYKKYIAVANDMIKYIKNPDHG